LELANCLQERLNAKEICGGHFREEVGQTIDGEPKRRKVKRNDTDSFVDAWE